MILSSPGMPEMLSPSAALVGSGLGAKVALVTDGRFSGATHGRRGCFNCSCLTNDIMMHAQVLWWGMYAQRHSAAVT